MPLDIRVGDVAQLQRREVDAADQAGEGTSSPAGSAGNPTAAPPTDRPHPLASSGGRAGADHAAGDIGGQAGYGCARTQRTGDRGGPSIGGSDRAGQQPRRDGPEVGQGARPGCLWARRDGRRLRGRRSRRGRLNRHLLLRGLRRGRLLRGGGRLRRRLRGGRRLVQLSLNSSLEPLAFDSVFGRVG